MRTTTSLPTPPRPLVGSGSAGAGAAAGSGAGGWMPNMLRQFATKIGLASSLPRRGGVADLDILAGEMDGAPSSPATVAAAAAAAAPSVRWSWWWLLLVVLLLVIVGLIIWWVILIINPKRVKDLSVRDLNSRDIAACGNMTVAGLTVLAGTTKVTNGVSRALSFMPLDVSDLNTTLDGTESSIILTNQSGSIVTVTLPPAADHRGLVLTVFNQTTNPVFHVDPQGTDTIEGSNATAVENSSALLVSMGTTPSGLANWKQIM